MKKEFLATLLGIFSVANAAANDPYTTFNNFDGKTQMLCVRDIVQTADGMMWLAAEDALYSFDGHHLVRHPLMQDGQERRGLGSLNRLTDHGDSLVIERNLATLSFNLTDHTFRVLELRDAMLMLMSNFIHWARPHVWTQDERMKHVLEYIHAHIGDNIDVETLANVANVTKSYFIHVFKREFNASPVRYVNQKKVERAQLLLFTTDDSVKEVAYALGFSDQNYFIRLFRKATGTTPQEYRRKIKG